MDGSKRDTFKSASRIQEIGILLPFFSEHHIRVLYEPTLLSRQDKIRTAWRQSQRMHLYDVFQSWWQLLLEYWSSLNMAYLV